MPAGQPPSATHSSVYRISGRQASWEAYDKELRRFGIFVKARNSLVFQVGLPPGLPVYWGFIRFPPFCFGVRVPHAR